MTDSILEAVSTIVGFGYIPVRDPPAALTGIVIACLIKPLAVITDKPELSTYIAVSPTAKYKLLIIRNVPLSLHRRVTVRAALEAL
jgi:hypothetical protein